MPEEEWEDVRSWRLGCMRDSGMVGFGSFRRAASKMIVVFINNVVVVRGPCSDLFTVLPDLILPRGCKVSLNDLTRAIQIADKNFQRGELIVEERPVITMARKVEAKAKEDKFIWKLTLATCFPDRLWATFRANGCTPLSTSSLLHRIQVSSRCYSPCAG